MSVELVFSLSIINSNYYLSHVRPLKGGEGAESDTQCIAIKSGDVSPNVLENKILQKKLSLVAVVTQFSTPCLVKILPFYTYFFELLTKYFVIHIVCKLCLYIVCKREVI